MEGLKKPRAIEPLEIRTVGEEALVHDSTNGKVHVLNPTAGKILRMCDGSRSLGDITATLVAETGARPEEVAADVDAMVAQFRDLGLLVGADGRD
ncbi:MAG: HPr-rel-A system PqqD family peptide chaperone [Candidatus Eremiobacteraeota bacterium]|nr:HPr-rel-A system PqqD family peptide chaperone [Candidatus Eremiobacteraeota bacterium]MBC5827285.1 HPr-rel-A system PqqD family peptide chaperone [Candidatus Eremiobacteraeota bacterium]